jgi:hypothetical protein
MRQRYLPAINVVFFREAFPQPCNWTGQVGVYYGDTLQFLRFAQSIS